MCFHDRGNRIQRWSNDARRITSINTDSTQPSAPKKVWCTSWDMNTGPLAVCRAAIPLHQRVGRSKSCEFYRTKTFRVSWQNYLAYVRKATIDLNKLGQGKLVGCRTNFNRSKIFLSPSFVEVLQLGIVAKEQRFPKLCPTMANSRDRAQYRACNEAC